MTTKSKWDSEYYRTYYFLCHFLLFKGCSSLEFHISNQVRELCINISTGHKVVLYFLNGFKSQWCCGGCMYSAWSIRITWEWSNNGRQILCWYIFLFTVLSFQLAMWLRDFNFSHNIIEGAPSIVVSHDSIWDDFRGFSCLNNLSCLSWIKGRSSS